MENHMKSLMVAAILIGFCTTARATCTPWVADNSSTCNYQELGGNGTPYSRTCDWNTSDGSLPVCSQTAHHHPYPLPACATQNVCLQNQTPDDIGTGCGAWSVDDSGSCFGQSLNYYTRWNTCTTLGDGHPEHFCAASTPSDWEPESSYTTTSFDPDDSDWVNCYIKKQNDQCSRFN